MGHIKPYLKAFLPHKPVGRTLVLRERPFVETSGHQRLIAPKVHKGANPEWTDKLAPPDRSEIRHGSIGLLTWCGVDRVYSSDCAFTIASC